MRAPTCACLALAAILLGGAPIEAQLVRSQGSLPAGSATMATRRQLGANQRQLAERFNAGDMYAVAGLYAADALLLPPNAPSVRGRNAIMSHWMERRRQGARNLRLRTTELQQEGDRVIELGVYEVDRGPGSAPERGKFMVIWKRNVRGQWELHRDMYSADDAPSTPVIAPPQVRNNN
jgi:ketosteroid isomerase-like protein